MAAGREHVSASREPVGSRSFRVPLFNEKEYFYRKRVLRRMQKVAGSACRPALPVLKEQTEEVAALVARCSLLEWSAAVSQYNVSNLEERLRRLEAATELPPLPLPAAVPKTYDIAPPSAPTAGAGSDRTAQEVPQEEPKAPAGADEVLGVDAAPPLFEEGVSSPDAGIQDSRDAAEPLRDRFICQWAVLHGLQKSQHLNGRLVRVGSRRANGRFETERPGSHDRQAVRPENLRELLETYDGHAAGDEVAFGDDEFKLIGYDPVGACWACKKEGMYCWVPVRNFS